MDLFAWNAPLPKTWLNPRVNSLECAGEIDASKVVSDTAESRLIILDQDDILPRPLPGVSILTADTLGRLQVDTALSRQTVAYVSDIPPPVPPLANSQIYSQLGPVTVANDSYENTLFGPGITPDGPVLGPVTLFPANYFQPGYSVMYQVGGTFSTSGVGRQFRFRIRTYSGAVFDTGIITLPTVATMTSWDATIVFTYLGLTSVTTSMDMTFSNGVVQRGFTKYQRTNTYDATVDNTLNLTIQWTTALPGNTLTCNYGVMTRTY